MLLASFSDGLEQRLGMLCIDNVLILPFVGVSADQIFLTILQDLTLLAVGSV